MSDQFAEEAERCDRNIKLALGCPPTVLGRDESGKKFRWTAMHRLILEMIRWEQRPR